MCIYNRLLRYVKKGTEINLYLKSVTMIDSLTGRFKIMQYNEKSAMSIANLFETTWLTRYTRPMEIMYDQGSEFIGYEFRKARIGI